MKKRAVIISTLLSVSLMLTGCSWSDIKAKFTGEDTGANTGASQDYVASECVTVPEYKGISVDCTVSDEDLQSEIDSFLQENSSEKKVKKGKCKEGDSVNIDYVGKVDGKAFDNGSAEGQTITLGSSGYVDGFDDGVIGMKVGQKKDIDVTFPEDYQETSLAGKPAVFTVTLNYISETITPELTDELVADKTDYKTVDEYKKATLENLKKDKKESAGQNAYSEVEEKAEVKNYPEALVKTCSDQLDAYYQYMSTQYGFTDFNTFLTQMGMDEATYKENLTKAAQGIAKTQLLTEAIAEKEGITVSDEEIKTEIAKVAEESGQEEADLKKNFESLYGDSITVENYYKITLLTNKVVDFIGENAVIKE